MFARGVGRYPDPIAAVATCCQARNLKPQATRYHEINEPLPAPPGAGAALLPVFATTTPGKIVYEQWALQPGGAVRWP